MSRQHCRRFAVCAQHTLPHTLFTAAHCRTQCTLLYTTCTTHNTYKSLPQQPTGSSTQAMHIPTNPTDGKSQCTWTDQSDWRVLRDDRIFGGLQALQWIGTVGVGAATHTNGQLTKRGDLHQRGDNQSRFPRAPSPVAPNPKTALNHKMTRVQQYISLAPIPQEQKTAADILNLGVAVYLQPD